MDESGGKNRTAVRPPFRRSKLGSAITSILASLTAGSLSTHAALDEVVVTAAKREQDLQDTALAVQALDVRRLEEQRIDTFEDYVAGFANINAMGRGPGQDEVYIRGAAIDAINIGVAEAQGVLPNVALYLDEQPVSAGGRNLDVYITDMERIEVLPGPQGTLYGASSQAGTVRLISNKPLLDEVEVGFDATTSLTADGEPSTGVEAVLNVPLIDEQLAVRAVLFSDKQGGYIDNVPGVLVPDPVANRRLPPAEGIMFVPAGGDPRAHEFANGDFAEPGRTYPVQYTAVHNDELVEDNFNDAAYEGARVGAKFALAPGFEITAQHHRQTLEVDGIFDYDPTLGDLKVARFNPDRLEDAFGQSTLTLAGRMGLLDLLYAGSFLERDTEHTQDYTEYVNFGAYIPGYICEYNTPGAHGGGGVGYVNDPTLSGDPGIIECGDGTALFEVDNRTANQTHEIRLTGAFGDGVSFTAGVFFQDLMIEHIGDYKYGTLAWNRIDPSRVSVGKANDPTPRSPYTQFANDITRSFEELAAFGDLHLPLTERVTFTVGARHYDLQVGYEGFSAFRYGSQPVPNLAGEPGVTTHPDITGGRDYAQNLGEFQPLGTSDLVTKLGLSWQATGVLLYGHVSEGYRPPGFNRAAAAGAATAEGVAARANGEPGFPDYFIPTMYRSDAVTNYEAGWKALLLDGRVRFNGAAYRTEWDDIQVSHFDSINISIFNFIDNAGDAEIEGVEVTLEGSPSERLGLYGAFAWNQTELTRVNPALDFFLADAGSELPLAPEFQATAGMRYEQEVGGRRAFVQIDGRYASESFNSLVDFHGVSSGMPHDDDGHTHGAATEPRRVQEPYTVVDVSVGILGDVVLMGQASTVWTGWSVELFADNVTDERAQLHISRRDFRERVATIRPRTIGLRISFDLL